MGFLCLSPVYGSRRRDLTCRSVDQHLYGVSNRLTYQALADGRVYLNLVLKGVKE